MKNTEEEEEEYLDIDMNREHYIRYIWEREQVRSYDFFITSTIKLSVNLCFLKYDDVFLLFYLFI